MDRSYFARKRNRERARAMLKFGLLTNEVKANAGAAQEIGVLYVENGSGTYTFTLTDNDGGRFDVSGNKLRRTGSGSIAAGETRWVAATADNGVDAAIPNRFQIVVTA